MSAAEYRVWMHAWFEPWGPHVGDTLYWLYAGERGASITQQVSRRRCVLVGVGCVA